MEWTKTRTRTKLCDNRFGRSVRKTNTLGTRPLARDKHRCKTSETPYVIQHYSGLLKENLNSEEINFTLYEILV